MKSQTMIAARTRGNGPADRLREEGRSARKRPSEAEAAATPAVDLAAEEQAIRNRSGEWMNYANSKDAASIANGIFAPDGIMISDEKAYRGTAEIQAALEAQDQEGARMRSSAGRRTRSASPDAGDLAVELGSFTFDPDGEGKKPARQGSFATTWAKVDGQWRVTSDAGGDNVEAAKP